MWIRAIPKPSAEPGWGFPIMKHGSMFLGADVKVESTLGEGSRFILTIPE